MKVKSFHSKPKLWYQILESIATNFTDENMWVSINLVKKHLENNCQVDTKEQETKIKDILKEMCQMKLLVKKKQSFTFMAKDIVFQKEAKQIKRERKNDEKTSTKKYLGPDVHITKTGRVSIKKSYDFYAY